MTFLSKLLSDQVRWTRVKYINVFLISSLPATTQSGTSSICELNEFLSNQEFQESIGGTVDAAVNLTGTVARV